MQIPVLIEPVAAVGFRARTGEPLPLSAEGATRAEALGKLQEMLENKLKNGSELATLDLGPRPHPLAEFAGRYANDPMIEEWREAVEEYRRQKNDE